jgi:large subunit ribosomal protein L24
MSRIKTHVKKGDQVTVIAGAFKGVQGPIISVDSEKGRVFVEGVEKVKRTIKASQEKPQGGFIDKDRPIAISNVKLTSGKEKTAKVSVKTAAKKAVAKKASKKAAKKSVD